VYANDSAIESSGYSKEELLTMNGMQLDISLTKALWPMLLEELRAGETLTAESQLTKKDGTTVPVETISNYYNNSSGEFIFAFSRDITKRKLAERELAESEEKFSKSFQTGAALMAISSVETGEYFEVNQAFLKTLGYSRKEVIGKKPEELKIFSDFSQRKAIKKMVEEKGYARDVEIEILTKNGDKRIGLFSADIISVKEKPYLLTLMNDVTERRKAEKELNKYKDHLEVLVKERTHELEKAQHELLIKEKLATLGQLTATVSHEIRNPLSTVRTAVYSIEKAIKNNDLEKVGHILKLAERNIVRCDNIINELLGYTRKRELFSIKVDIDEWLTRTLSEFDISSEVEFIEDLQSGVEVLLDTEHFRRVMVNLVDNALHSLVDNNEGKKILKISTRKNKNNLELIIKDTGIGIRKENIERIFDPLFSTKSFGIGLGLSVVKQIVEEHGGTIIIESEEGKGSTVTIVLPLKSKK
jgi:PAS domain S-box-containing protein